jgi:hypothetical protein
MPNQYYGSDGKRYSEATIKTNLSKAYKEYYLFEPLGSCEGCGDQATCTAHIIPKAICKTLRKTELIWNPKNWFRSCFSCNSIAENVSGEEIKTLMNFTRIKEVLRVYDPERYLKVL